MPMIRLDKIINHADKDIFLFELLESLLFILLSLIAVK